MTDCIGGIGGTGGIGDIKQTGETGDTSYQRVEVIEEGDLAWLVEISGGTLVSLNSMAMCRYGATVREVHEEKEIDVEEVGTHYTHDNTHAIRTIHNVHDIHTIYTKHTIHTLPPIHTIHIRMHTQFTG